MSSAALLGAAVVFWTLIGVAIYLIIRSTKKSAPAPVQTPPPAPAPVQSPAPAPAPASFGTPAQTPYFAPAPAPVQTSAPAPYFAPAPAPVQTSAPAPYFAPAPSPVQTSAPATYFVPAPAPVRSPAPAPYFAPAPAPVRSPAPAPYFAPAPAPVQSPAPAPYFVPAPAPVRSPAPAPYFAPAPAPVRSPAPAPAPAPAPKVNCVQTEGTWGDCSKKCGGGLKTRKNPVTVEPSGGGTACPFPREESRICNTTECPIDCVQDTSQAWGLCSKPCGGGKMTKPQPITTYPNATGKACGDTTLTDDCNTHDCPVDCVEGTTWSKVGDCSKDCGGGKQTWTHLQTQPKFGGKACGPETKELDCNTQACPVNCVGSWQNGTTCSSTTCGVAGSYTDTYKITTAAANGGAPCETTDNATRNTRSCTPPDTSCNQDCVGKWNIGTTCSTNKCGETGKFTDKYSVSVVKKGTGNACEAANDATRDGAACSAPSNTCDRDCVGRWEAHRGEYSPSKGFYDNYDIYRYDQTKQGTGNPCPYSQNLRRNQCVYEVTGWEQNWCDWGSCTEYGRQFKKQNSDTQYGAPACEADKTVEIGNCANCSTDYFNWD